MNSSDALIALVCQKKRVPGKKVLQKLVYFLQEAEGLRIGLTYRMRQYGPYSDELEDLGEDLAQQGRISIQYGDPGFEITPGPHAGDAEIPQEINDRVAALLAKLGSEGGLTLELLATIHFLARAAKSTATDIDENEMIRRVTAWKGSKYNPTFIRTNIQKLRQMGYFPT